MISERAYFCSEIVNLFRQVYEGLAREKVAQGTVLAPEHPDQGSNDVHAFFLLLQKPSRTVHVQGYPGFSTPERALVYARVMDSARLRQLGEMGHGSVGNEHEAVISDFPQFPGQQWVSYNPEDLLQRLRSGIVLMR